MELSLRSKASLEIACSLSSLVRLLQDIERQLKMHQACHAIIEQSALQHQIFQSERGSPC